MLIMISAGYSKERWNIILNIRNEISFHRAMESNVVKSLWKEPTKQLETVTSTWLIRNFLCKCQLHLLTRLAKA